MTDDTTSIEMNGTLEVANLVQVAKSILESLASETLLHSHKAQKLRDPVSEINQKLLDAEKSLASGHNRQHFDFDILKGWVRGVSKALYEASDLVDQVVADGAASSLVSKVRCRSLFGLSRSSKSGIFGVRIDPIINRLCQNLTQLKQDATNLLGLDLEEEHVTLEMERNPARCNMDNVVGREDEKEALVARLLDNLNRQFCVDSIVGVGGVGKTTLAELVFNDERITSHFDLKLWVCVGTDFEIKKILKSIISCCSPVSSRIGDLDLPRLQDLSKNKLSGNIFLLVLDDVWNEDDDNWFSLLPLFRLGARGSKILVTTRSFQVAQTCRSEVFDLRGLSSENSWTFFINSLRQLKVEQTENLLHIGRSIVIKCNGIPLAIALVASWLSGLSVEEWQDACIRPFMPCVDFYIPNLMLIVKQSYDYLPPHLKVCFACCSLFPEDQEIKVNDLVSLWMAQGYIEPEDSRIDLEDIAMQHVSVLCSRVFFINRTIDEFGNIATCMVHDAFQDFAKTAAKEWGTMKHLSLFYKRDTTWLRENLEDESKVQSFLHWTSVEDEDGAAGRISINDIVQMSNFKSLRVLDLHAFGLQVLPDSIGRLVHLRYLDCSRNDALLKLPNSIANLYHLQTLKLNSCCELEGLPTSIGKLVRLRRLEIDGCEKLTFMPRGFKNLSSLRQLSRFVVGRPRSQFASGFEALGNLKHLRGRLMIELSENWATTADEAEKSKLKDKHKLTELEIKWELTRCTGIIDEVQHQSLLNGLRPPTGLQKLQIEGYRGDDFPSWAKGDSLSRFFPHLISISIDGCGNCNTLPRFSCLRLLKRLSLQHMDNVVFFESSDNSTSESPFFPSLQELTLDSFYSLERWWEDRWRVLSPSASFGSLKKLQICSCPKLQSMPVLPKVEVLDMQNINHSLTRYHTAQIAVENFIYSNSTIPSSSRSAAQNLQNLKAVDIKSCPNLKTLDLLYGSEKLEKLVVERLDKLNCLKILETFTLLEELKVDGCKDLDLSGGCQGNCTGCEECNVPWKCLSKLRRLSLRELPRLVTLPVSLKCVTSLQHLRLEGCPALKMLPEGLEDIRSLEKIDIIECPLLTERCSEGGEDWHKIKHAQVLCHKSWRYALMSETDSSQKPKERGENVVVHSEDPTIHVDVTVKRLQT